MDREPRVLSRIVAPAALSPLLAVGPLGCLPQADAEEAEGGAEASTETTVGDAGTACTESLSTGVTLCAGISSCPTIGVDQSTLPGCGFRIQAEATVLDLECNCGFYVCPIGLPGTCAAAATLLDGLSYATVCAQASQGECASLAPAASTTTPAATTSATTSPTTTSTSSTSTSTTSTCNTQCIISCGDAPDCQQLCGC